MTPECSDLLSPLYEHDLTLVACDATSLVDVHHILGDFTGETCFRVAARRGFRYRLDKQYKHKELAKKLRELLGRTYFLAADFHHQPSPVEDATLFGPLFPRTSGSKQFHHVYFNCDNETECTTLRTYVLILSVLAEKKSRGRKSMYDLYWTEFAGEHASLLDTAMTHLLQFAPHDKLYQQRDILALFQSWKSYQRIGRYITHQVLGMDVTYALYRLFGERCSILGNPSLMPLNARIDTYNFCQLLIKTLRDEEAQRPHTPLPLASVPVTLLTEHLKGGLYELFRLCISHCQMDTRLCSAFKVLQRQILLPCLIRKIECLATNRASYNKATLDAITLHAIYLVYHSLTSTAAPLTWPKDEALFEIEPHGGLDDSEDDGLPIALAHSLTDFNAMLKLLYRAIAEQVDVCTSTATHRWQLKDSQSGALMARSNTVLFFIGTDLKSLDAEEVNRRIYEQCIVGRATTRLCHYHITPLAPETWQEEFNVRKNAVATVASLPQDMQFVLFTPAELKQNVDLACLKDLLFEDLFNSVILREQSDRHFHRRLSEYFASEQESLRMSLFHRERCFATLCFESIPKEAIKETVFIPQAHMLSLESLQNLLKWLIMKRQVVKRVIFLGTLEIIASQSHGQGFMDLLRAIELQAINQALYNYDQTANHFATLLEEQWRYLAWLDKENGGAQHFYDQESLFLQSDMKCAILYHLKNAALLSSVLSRRHVNDRATKKICLYALYKRPFNPTQKHANPLIQCLSTSFGAAKSAHFNVASLEIDNLPGYDAMAPQVTYFVISRRCLLALDKNQLTLLFTMVDALYVLEQVDGEFGDKEKSGSLLDLLCTQFRETRRPNVRYSYTCLTR